MITASASPSELSLCQSSRAECPKTLRSTCTTSWSQFEPGNWRTAKFIASGQDDPWSAHAYCVLRVACCVIGPRNTQYAIRFIPPLILSQTCNPQSPDYSGFCGRLRQFVCARFLCRHPPIRFRDTCQRGPRRYRSSSSRSEEHTSELQ